MQLKHEEKKHTDKGIENYSFLQSENQPIPNLDNQDFIIDFNVTVESAKSFYDNFEGFLEAWRKSTLNIFGKELFGVLTKITQFFNMSLQKVPELADKCGKLVFFLKSSLDNGGNGGEPPYPNVDSTNSLWKSYSIEFGFPSGVALILNF